MTASRTLIGFVLAACLSGCAANTGSVPSDSAQQIQLAAPDGRSVTLTVELARTPAEQERGLKERTSLAYGAGMLFLFPDSSERSFWMKDTLIPLDVAFFDDRGQLVSVASMEPCAVPAGTSCPSTLSQGPARYALEVPRGYFAVAGLETGWKLVLGPWASS